MNTIKKIVLIDDDTIANTINTAILRKVNVAKEIHVFTSARDALEFLTGTTGQSILPSPDIIFLDINMPLMDGIEFMEAYFKLEKEGKAKVVIALETTQLNHSVRSKMLKWGVTEFIEKPLSEEKICHIIDNHLILQKNNGYPT